MQLHDEGIPHLDVLLLIGIDINKVLEGVAVLLDKPGTICDIRPNLRTRLKEYLAQRVEERLLGVGDQRSLPFRLRSRYLPRALACHSPDASR